MFRIVSFVMSSRICGNCTNSCIFLHLKAEIIYKSDKYSCRGRPLDIPGAMLIKLTTHNIYTKYVHGGGGNACLILEMKKNSLL